MSEVGNPSERKVDAARIQRAQHATNNLGIDRREIRQGSPRVGGNPSHNQPGIFAAFQLSCDGKGCDGNTDPLKKDQVATVGFADSRDVIDAAHRKGLITDLQIESYAFERVREGAFKAGWTVDRRDEGAAEDEPGKDYCPECMKKGRCPGDKTRPGSGRRRSMTRREG